MRLNFKQGAVISMHKACTCAEPQARPAMRLCRCGSYEEAASWQNAHDEGSRGGARQPQHEFHVWHHHCSCQAGTCAGELGSDLVVLPGSAVDDGDAWPP